MIIVTSLKDHYDVCKSVHASHLISVIDPGFAPTTPKFIKHHLKLGFDDIIEINKNNFIHRNLSFTKSFNLKDQILPNMDHINQIIEFVSSWNQKKPIVIHCWCGVSRSMAVAIFIFCKIFPNNIESNVRYMRSIAAHANPNKLMVSLFEKYLNIEGQISEAFKKYPYTITYDCDTNFAPVSIFKINEILNFK
tara:strand:+ start:1498 stop:2076 length:579 start_codon:yes stop_codon:yes gene_type:complete